MLKIGDITNTADGNGEFTNGNVAAGVAPTILDAAWFNSVQRELINALAAAGIKPSQSDDAQLAEAIRKMIQKSVPNASLTQPGLVQLSNATKSHSETEAATSRAVKDAYNLANEAYATAFHCLSRNENGADIEDKSAFLKNLGLGVT
ncbi:phage tail protein, partial [Xenorhabdus sp. XENO-10]